MIQNVTKRALGRSVCCIGFATAIFTLALAALQAAPCHASTQESLTVGGVTRVYYVYTPKSYSAETKVPVVFVLHPLTKDAAWAEHTMGWDQCADKNGFLVVYGQSSSDIGIWNAGLSDAERASGADDVGYLEAVMDAVESAYAVDMSRVYMVGFSAGGIMTAKMGATVPKSLTAIATVAGITGFADKDVLVPTAPLSIITFRGTADRVAPYTSDAPSVLFNIRVYSAASTAADWAHADGCSQPPTTTQINGGHIVETDYMGGVGGAEVQLMTVNGGKHEYRLEDTGLIWQFFSAHTKLTVSP